MPHKTFPKVLLLFFFLLTLPFFVFGRETQDLITYSRLVNGYWQIWIINAATKETSQLTNSPLDKRYPVWIENGKKIMYRTSNAEMFTFDLTSKKETKILSKFGVITDPAWSSKTKQLVFTRYDGYLKDESEIWTVNLDGSIQRMLTKQPGMQYNPAWSADGKQIVYSSGKSVEKYDLWLMDADGGNKKEISSTESGRNILPSFSSDGKMIVFVSDRGGDYDVWVMDKTGKNLKNLTKSLGLDTKPCFSPDSARIVFTSTRSGKLQLWIMDVYGNNLRQLTDNTTDCQDPAWIQVNKDQAKP